MKKVVVFVTGGDGMGRKIELISSREVMLMLSISKPTLCRWTRDRLIPHYKFNVNNKKFNLY